jgi:GNAT superfamily N-acetyltransferase
VAILRRGFELYLSRVWLRHEETYTVEDSAGVCVWEPPGAWKPAVREQPSLLPAMLRVFGRNLPRLLGTLNVVERNHPTEPHFYLAFVGVDPESQGRGIGSILMHPIVQRCDAEGIPAYLEAALRGTGSCTKAMGSRSPRRSARAGVDRDVADVAGSTLTFHPAAGA